jgi:hypothetical protein
MVSDIRNQIEPAMATSVLLMQPEDPEVPVMHQPRETGTMPETAPNESVRSSFALSIVALALYVATFSVLWLPVYMARSGAGLFLWPAALVVLLVVGVLSILAIASGVRGLKRAHADETGSASGAVFGIAVGLFLVVLGGPLLWFGDAPLVLLTGQSGFDL